VSPVGELVAAEDSVSPVGELAAAEDSVSPIGEVMAADDSVSPAPIVTLERTPTETPPPYAARQSDVVELLAGFTVAEAKSLRELSRELKLIAGVAVTPAPPATSSPRGDGNGS
jgi:hypothetical protein